jgi:predicted nucleic acid-binding protein
VVFVDSSFWIAAVIDADAHHEDAAELLSRHAGDRLVTTNHVCGETWTFIRRRFGHREAVAVIDRLERTPAFSGTSSTSSWNARHGRGFDGATSVRTRSWMPPARPDAVAADP